MSEPNRFSISWDRGAYYVSIPDYKGGEVVPAGVADALVKALQRLDAFLDFNDDELGKVWEFDDLSGIQAAFDEARAALALAAPPVEQAKTEVRTSFVLDGSCPTCQALAKGEMCPPHDASPRCESGKRNHCSCDVCF